MADHALRLMAAIETVLRAELPLAGGWLMSTFLKDSSDTRDLAGPGQATATAPLQPQVELPIILNSP